MIFASDKGRMCNNIFCHYPPCILSQLKEFKLHCVANLMDV
ncbi:unknown [Prevotella sp. CAG:1092]|nr:unknown [Prevotella sp. CAG:1092]